MDFPGCSQQWISLTAAILSFILFLASEILGIIKGKGTCSSLVQLCLSGYHRLRKTEEPQKESAEWLNKA